MALVFLVEDDDKLRKELCALLGKYGYECRASQDWAHMADVILRENPNLILLDINLPVYDGFYLCRELRRRSQIPVVVLTSRESEADELTSMSLGADDFVTKPFNSQILLARIAAVLKRCGTEATQTVSFQGVLLDLSRSMVEYRGGSVELTKNEMKILHLLLCGRGRIISREEMMTALWQTKEFVDDNTLTVNINRLRKKLESIGLQDFLLTKRGQGYRI